MNPPVQKSTSCNNLSRVPLPFGYRQNQIAHAGGATHSQGKIRNKFLHVFPFGDRFGGGYAQNSRVEKETRSFPPFILQLLEMVIEKREKMGTLVCRVGMGRGRQCCQPGFFNSFFRKISIFEAWAIFLC